MRSIWEKLGFAALGVLLMLTIIDFANLLVLNQKARWICLDHGAEYARQGYEVKCADGTIFNLEDQP